MQYPDLAIRTAIYKLLSDAQIQAFDSIADTDAGTSYVLIQNQDNIDYSTKSGYGFLHTVTLSAVVISQISTGREEAENLLNEALRALMADKPKSPIKIVLAPFRFHCWMVKAGPSKDLVFVGETETVYQKIVTLSLNVDYVA